MKLRKFAKLVMDEDYSVVWRCSVTNKIVDRPLIMLRDFCPSCGEAVVFSDVRKHTYKVFGKWSHPSFLSHIFGARSVFVDKDKLEEDDENNT